MGEHLTRTFNPFTVSNKNYLDQCRKIWADTTDRKVTPIFTLKHLSLLSHVPYTTLKQYTHRKVNPYKKVILQSETKKRELLIPWKELAIVQNWIKKNILDHLESSDNSTAYDKNCSIVKNANKHINSKWLIKLDLKNFFSSIYEKDIYKIFFALGYTELFSLELAKLCTYQAETAVSTKNLYPYAETKGYLPQGASTSPKLANIFAKKLDQEISALLAEKYSECNSIFTRYSDDIIISGDLKDQQNCKQLICDIKKIINKNKLRINNKKTKIFSSNSIKKVTGINIIREQLRPSKKILNYIKTSLYYIEKFGIEKHLEHIKHEYHYDEDTYKEHLLGKIHFVKFINNDIGKDYIDKFNKLFPE